MRKYYALIITCFLLLIANTSVFATQSRSENFSKAYSLSGNGACDIVAVAEAQVGKTQSQMGYTEGWCADFVSDCGKLAGQSEAVGFSGGPSELYAHYSIKGSRDGFIPQVGDIAFICSCYELNETHYSEHVGIVVAVSDTIVTTVEGNIFTSGASRVVKYNYNRSNGNVVTGRTPWNKIVRYGRPTYKGGVVDTVPPTISNVRVTDLSSTGYTVTCTVSDNVGVTSVKFPTWPAADGSWNPIWHEGIISGSMARCRINVSDHGGITGTNYATHIYAYDAAGNSSNSATDWVSVPAPDNTAPTITNVRISDVSNSGYTVHCTVWDNETVTKVNYVTWTPDKGGFDDKLEQAKTSGFSGKGQTTTLSFRVYTKDHNYETGRYATHIYAYDATGNCTDALTNAAVGGKYWGATAKTTYNGHTYELYDTRYWKWTTVKSYCDSVGGYLVCITSDGEQKAVQTLLQKGKRDGYWIGSTDQYVEGNWTWVTGEIMSYTNWCPSGQPDNYNNQEDYGMLWQSSGLWNDVPEDVRDSNGNGVYGFICEYDSSGATIPEKQNQTISANCFIKTVGDATFPIDATTSGNGGLSYSSSNTNVASVSSNGTVTIKGVGIAKITLTADSTSTYNEATKTITVTVNPKSTTLSSLKNSSKKKLKISWKRNSMVTGYKIQVATNSDFTNARTYTVKSNRTLTKTISVIKGTIYYVRICTFKGNLQSSWSAAKKLKIIK